ncbi:DsbA family protein [Magnetovibrio sp. PR-2]|uniref:DsbA family protein n=1 Tax=Magnetovibrio sp. PR-2 TaxID=3120356 RepID=UPI002FCDE97B
MKLIIERVTLIAAMALFGVTGVSGWLYFEQRAVAQPVQDSQQSTENILKTYHEALYNNPRDPILGNPDGDVTIIEFYDYRCPFCKKVHPVVMQLLEDDGNIRYIAKEYPILGPVSVLASQAALASQKYGKYAEYSNALMSARNLDDNLIFKIALDVGLDPLKLLDDIDANETEINDTIQEVLDLGQDMRLQGTPTFIIGDNLIPGAINRNVLDALVAQVRSKNTPASQ